MKITMFLVVFGVMMFLTHNLAAQDTPWMLLHKYGNNQGTQAEELNHIQFVDGKNGWVVGERGLIKITIDGGNTWKNLMSPTNKTLGKSFFIDNQKGWVYGAQGALFYTSDGGKSWNDLSIVGSTAFIRDLYFSNENKGWMIHENQVYQTKDGGKTWKDVALPRNEEQSRKLYAYQIIFVDDTLGWILLSDGLYKSVDGGETWAEISTLNREKFGYGSFASITALDSKTIGIVVNQPDCMLHSQDGGNQWKKIKIPVAQDDNSGYLIYRIIFQSNGTWLLYGGDDVFTSQNSGASWKKVNSSFLNSASVSFIDDNKIGFRISQDGILKTEDGGKSWIVHSERPLPSINDVYFTSPSAGFAVGNESTILMTKDGGASWIKSTVEVPNLILTSLTLITSTQSWITGSQGAVLRMEENGARWSHKSYSEDIQFNSDAEREMLKNTFPDGKNHFVIHKIVNFNLKELWMFAREPYGLGVSHIFRTIDGGDNWVKVPPAQEYNFVDFIMSNRVQFYAIDRNNLYLSNDACLTWHQIPLPKSTWFNLWQIQRVPNFGYVIRTDRSLLFYNPSQNSISEKPFKNNLKIKATTFRNAELGWGISDNRVYETTDGGDTWNPITAEGAIRVKLNSITFFDDNNLWVYGENGFIAHLEKDVPPRNPEQEFKDEIKNRLNNFINRSRD